MLGFASGGLDKQDTCSRYSFLVDATIGSMVASDGQCCDGNLTYEYIDSLIARYRPVAYIHPKDQYLPISAEDFISICGLEVFGHGCSSKKLMEPGCVTLEKLHEIQAMVDEPDMLRTPVPEEHRFGVHHSQIDDVPLYVTVKNIVDAQGKSEALEITYINFHTFNGHYAIGPFGWCMAAGTCLAPAAGHHDGDWEHITVRVHPTKGHMQGVWYNRHRNVEGSWVPARDVPVDPETGRILGFIAINGHGWYPSAGLHARIWCMANDRCGYGPRWQAKRCVWAVPSYEKSRIIQASSRGCVLDHDPNGGYRSFAHVDTSDVVVERLTGQWVDYGGRWGSITAPARQGWFTHAEPPVSWGWWRTLFCPLASPPQLTERRRATSMEEALVCTEHSASASCV